VPDPVNMAHKPDSGKVDEHWLDRHDGDRWSHEQRRPSAREWAREEAMRDWFGEDRGRMEILARQRPAAPIGVAVGEIMKEIRGSGGGLLDEIRAAWPTLVGEAIARQTLPRALAERCLSIEVSDSIWMYVLRTMHHSVILARVSEFTGEAVNRIRFTPHGRDGGWKGERGTRHAELGTRSAEGGGRKATRRTASPWGRAPDVER